MTDFLMSDFMLTKNFNEIDFACGFSNNAKNWDLEFFTGRFEVFYSHMGELCRRGAQSLWQNSVFRLYEISEWTFFNSVLTYHFYTVFIKK